jgi:hypothetical protein
VGKRHFFQSERENDYYLESVLVLDDNETFSKLEGASVIIFDDTAEANNAVEKIEETSDIQIAFNSVLSGYAEEVSLDRLVRFYLNNT